MASAQVSTPEHEEDLKVEEEEEVRDEDVVAHESEVEKVDAKKPAVEDKEDLFEVEDDVQGEDEEGHGGITEVPTGIGAKIIGDDDDDDELDAEGEGAHDEDAIHF